MTSTTTQQKYTGNQIKILKGLEQVRHRPGMFIGDTGKKGLHHLIWEILDNSIDEAMAGHCDEIQIKIHKDGETITIEDNGRGIPVDTHPTEGKSSLEVVMTVLHAGGKMSSDGNSGYMVSGGLHGVGASCVNALSDFMKVEVYREGYLWIQEYSAGVPKAEVKQLRKLEKSEKSTGTRSTWHPDKTIFKSGISVDEKEILRRLEETAYLNAGLKIDFLNEATGSKKIFKFSGGIKDYVGSLIESKSGAYPDEPVYLSGKEDTTQVELALAWTSDDDETILGYANNIHTTDGGTHITGFKNALTRTVNKLARSENILKEKDDNLDGKDILEGLTAIVSVKLPQPQFVGQTKAKLGTLEVESHVSTFLSEAFTKHFLQNAKDFSRIVERAVIAQRARKAARDAATALKKKSFLGGSGRIPEKLRDCRSGDILHNELFIVEGDSAAGSATQGRDSEYQAVLSIKGKIINAEKNDISALLKNNEVSDIILAVGTGIKDQFDIGKLNYGKIIIMADVDSDGKHILTLLTSLFYKTMRPIIEQGRLYTAVAPLYKVTQGKNVTFCWDDKELAPYLGKNCDITRFKGLGEMNADELGDTTMAKGVRKLIRFDSTNVLESERIFNVLMGSDVQIRKDHILKNVNKGK